MEDNWLFSTEPWDLPGKQNVSSSQQAYFAHGQGSHAPSSHRMGLASQNQQARTINPLDNELPYGEPHMLAKVRGEADGRSCQLHRGSQQRDVAMCNLSFYRMLRGS